MIVKEKVITKVVEAPAAKSKRRSRSRSSSEASDSGREQVVQIQQPPKVEEVKATKQEVKKIKPLIKAPEPVSSSEESDG